MGVVLGVVQKEVYKLDCTKKYYVVKDRGRFHGSSY